VYSVEVEEQGYLKAVQADVRVVLRRAAAVEFALVRGSDEVLAEVVVFRADPTRQYIVLTPPMPTTPGPSAISPGHPECATSAMGFPESPSSPRACY
jgi:hypothetical protein